MEKAVKEMGDKIPADKRESITGKIAELRSALTGEDLGRIRSLTDELQKMYSEAAQAVPQGQPEGQAQGNPGSQQSNGSSDGDVVDGEFTEK